MTEYTKTGNEICKYPTCVALSHGEEKRHDLFCDVHVPLTTDELTIMSALNMLVGMDVKLTHRQTVTLSNLTYRAVAQLRRPFIESGVPL